MDKIGKWGLGMKWGGRGGGLISVTDSLFKTKSTWKEILG